MKLTRLAPWVLLSACVSTPPPSESNPRRRMPEPAHLSASQRSGLSERMQSHGDDMNDLLWSLLFLDYESTRDIANHIAQQPAGVGPEGLPAEIFVFEGRLHGLAAELSRAAEEEDAAKVAELYGKIAETCVKCHATYLTEPPMPAKRGEEEGN